MFRMGLLGKKIGMTHVFVEGVRVPVTVLHLGPNTVVTKKTKDGKDGYDAIALGYGDKEHRKVNKPMAGHYKRADVKPKWYVRELRVDDAQKLAGFQVGQELRADVFQIGEWIDVTGTSKGKGFAGVMKRHNMKGAKQYTHGTHEYRRHVGSIGCRTTPGEVHKGKRLPGHMGDRKVTMQNSQVVQIDLERNLVLVTGSVPGARNSYVMVRQATKNLGKVSSVLPQQT